MTQILSRASRSLNGVGNRSPTQVLSTSSFFHIQEFRIYG